MAEVRNAPAGALDAAENSASRRAARDRAAAAVVAARLEERPASPPERVENLQLVGQAQGMLMGRRGLDAYDALRELAGLADRDRVELPDAARVIVATMPRAAQSSSPPSPGEAQHREGSVSMDEVGRRRHQRDGKPEDFGEYVGPVDSLGADPADDAERHSRESGDLVVRHEAADTDDAIADVRDDQASLDDQAAAVRDRAAEARDDRAARRDATAHDARSVPAFTADRRQARSDREEAAADRAEAVDDRGRARRDRKTARQGRQRASEDRNAATTTVAGLKMLLARAEENSEDMLLIGQAQGMLMDRRGLGASEALLEVCAQAGRDHSELREAAATLMDAARTANSR
jgi:AmiR/NasT family two-component response regulator